MYQEHPQESEVAEEDQEFGTDFANFYNTQGKHRFMYPSTLPKFKFMQAPVHLKPSVTTLRLSLRIAATYALSL